MSEKELLSNFTKKDSLRIVKKGDGGHIECLATSITFKDSDTNHLVVYLPSLELTGYGDTAKEAKEMLNFSVNEFFKYLIQLPTKKLKSELANLGWKQERFHSKEYSNSFVDADGTLRNFNLDKESVVEVKQEEFA